LSISSMKTMPFCSADCMAWARTSSSLSSLAASSSTSMGRAALIATLRCWVLAPPMFWNIWRSC